MADQTRSLGGARDAYSSLNQDASRAAHTLTAVRNLGDAEEAHSDAGDYLKSCVFGGLDGTVTTFTLVCAALGGNYSYTTIVVLGVAKVLSDAVSMGLGEGVSELAEVNYVRAEKAREKWEMDNHLTGELDEMVALYVEQGFEEEDAKTILGLMVEKNPAFFLDHMMVQELGMMPPDDESPLKKGLCMFASFAVCGGAVIMPFALAELHSTAGATDETKMYSKQTAYMLSVMVAILVLAGLGWLKAGLTNQNKVISSIQYVGVGAFSAAVAFGISSTVHRLLHDEN